MSRLVFKGEYGTNAPAMYRYLHKIDLLKTLRNKFRARTRSLFAAFPARYPIGSAAPDVRLESLDGQSVFLRDFRGKKHVVLEFGSYS